MQDSSNSKEAGSLKRSYGWRSPIAALGLLLSAFLLAASHDASARPSIDYTISKTGAVAQITLAQGQSYIIDYVVTVTPVGTPTSCVWVYDDLAGLLGDVCPGDVEKTFEYSITVTYPACGSFQVVNTATIEDKVTHAADSSTWTVDVSVPCAGSCTLTQGYWKTHSSYGPAPYDDTWALLTAGADTRFFLSGKSYYQALWTAPRGNAYWSLAHQYIAAQLNGLNGAAPAAIATQFAAATTILDTYTPAQIGALRANNTLLAQVKSLASAMDAYNNGITGPGHCDEDTD